MRIAIIPFFSSRNQELTLSSLKNKTLRHRTETHFKSLHLECLWNTLAAKFFVLIDNLCLFYYNVSVYTSIVFVETKARCFKGVVTRPKPTFRNAASGLNRSAGLERCAGFRGSAANFNLEVRQDSRLAIDRIRGLSLVRPSSGRGARVPLSPIVKTFLRSISIHRN